MPNSVYECGTPNCANAIATEGLNKVKLEALRRWAKTCDRCGKRTQWQEKVLLLNTETITQKPMEGKRNAKTKKATEEHIH